MGGGLEEQPVWSTSDKGKLLILRNRVYGADWQQMEEHFPYRLSKDLHKKYRILNEERKYAWTKEEDDQLIEAVEHFGPGISCSILIECEIDAAGAALKSSIFPATSDKH